VKGGDDMKIRLSQVISLKTYSEGTISISKEFQSNIIPHKGDMIGDSVWKDPYEHEVDEVIIDYSQDTCFVSLEMIKMDHDNIEVLKEWKQMVKLHGWEPLGYLK
jgi:hypothetical protein